MNNVAGRQADDGIGAQLKSPLMKVIAEPLAGGGDAFDMATFQQFLLQRFKDLVGFIVHIH